MTTQFKLIPFRNGRAYILENRAINRAVCLQGFWARVFAEDLATVCDAIEDEDEALAYLWTSCGYGADARTQGVEVRS